MFFFHFFPMLLLASKQSASSSKRKVQAIEKASSNATSIFTSSGISHGFSSKDIPLRLYFMDAVQQTLKKSHFCVHAVVMSAFASAFFGRKTLLDPAMISIFCLLLVIIRVYIDMMCIKNDTNVLWLGSRTILDKGLILLWIFEQSFWCALIAWDPNWLLCIWSILWMILGSVSFSLIFQGLLVDKFINVFSEGKRLLQLKCNIVA